MRIKRIDLDGDESPEFVHVRLTVGEALYLAALTGRQNGVSSEAVMAGGADFNSSVYGGLTGGVFNWFYDGGVEEAVRDR